MQLQELSNSRGLMPRAGFSRALLLAVAALAAMCGAVGTPVLGVGSFAELNLAVVSGARAVEITAREVVFDHQLEVWRARTPLLIKSSIGATLSGGYQTRLFFLQNGSKLSLRGVGLVDGVAFGTDCSECRPHGGAILMSVGSELRLHSTRVFNNRASQWGGAIYAIGSTITATDCQLTSNSASWGGAIYAERNSTVTAANCTMASNSAVEGGAVYARGDSTITATDCTMTANSAG